MIKRKSKNIERMLACLMAFMMVVAFYPLTAHSLGETINVNFADSFTQTTPEVLSTLDKSVTAETSAYTGKLTAKIDVNNMLQKAYEVYKKNESIAGPRVMYGPNKSAPAITYTVNMPAGQNVKITNTTQSENANTISAIKPEIAADGKSVKFTIEFPWLDYQGFFKEYEKDLAAGNKYLNLAINYEGTAAKGTSYESVKNGITASGGGELWYYGKWFSSKVMTIATDTATFPLFSAKSPQIDETPIMKTTLPGDLLLNGDTQSDKVIEVTPENSLKFTGSLDVSSIKKQMKQIEQKYGKSGADLENIKLHNPESTFTAKIILPKGLKAKNNLAVGTDVQLEGAAGTFAIVDAKNDGNGVITVKMTLQNTDKIKNYKDLKEAVDKCADELKVNVSAIQLEDTVKNNDQLTVKGELTGTMCSVAEYQGKAIKFSFEWKGEQKAGGKDSTATDDKAIQLTLKVKKPEEIQADAKLKGDILIGADTEHDAIFETKPGNIHDFTGALDVSDIKKAMNNYKTSMAPNDPSSGIKLEDTTSKFTATFTLPEGMEYTLPKTADNVQLLGAADTFKITNVVDNGKSIDVEMTLKQGIDDFDKLEKAINACDDTLKVIVKGVKVSDNTTNDQKLQVKGSIIGNMKAKAKLNNDIKNFNLNWTAVQSDEGRDKAATDNESITFTLNVNKPETYEIKDIPLEGDILINGDTEHDKVYETEPGAKLDYTGALNIAPIKDKMDEIEGQFFGADPDKIMLEGTKSEFTATFTLPEYVNYKDGITKDDIKFEGADGVFTVTDLQVSGKVATVKMTLRDGITKYTELKKAVKSCDNQLKVTIPTTVSEDLKEEKTLTAVGTLTGGMSAKAIIGVKEKNFHLTWKAKQSPEGKDKIATDDETIQGTIHVNQPTIVDGKVDLEGDILIGKETEHDELFPTKPRAKHDFTGALNVKPIKEQMAAIEKQHPGVSLDRISLDDVKSEFIAKFTLPEKLSFGVPLTTENVKLKGADGVFSVSDVKVEGKTVTVKMTLREGIHKYTELAKAIKDDCSDQLEVIIPQVTVSKNAKNGEIFTVVGELTGGMSAVAKVDKGLEYSPKFKFNFTWEAKQSPEGKDKIATDDDTIQFSLKAKVKTQGSDKPKPEKPNKPRPNPQKPEGHNPKTGDATGLEVYLMLLSMAVVGGGMVAARRKENDK